MLKNTVRLFIISSIIALSFHSLSFAGTIDINEGNWDITITMNMQDQQIPSETHKKCIKKEDIMPFDSNSQSKEADSECKPKNVKISGNKVTWTMDCNGMTGNGEINYNGDTFQGDIIINSAQGKVTQHLEGKRTGPCEE